MFIEALFIIAPNWRSPRCVSVDEWANCGMSMQWNTIWKEKRNGILMYATR